MRGLCIIQKPANGSAPPCRHPQNGGDLKSKEYSDLKFTSYSVTISLSRRNYNQLDGDSLECQVLLCLAFLCGFFLRLLPLVHDLVLVIISYAYCRFKDYSRPLSPYPYR